ncbi:hypothetical protein GGI04_000671 [Coemansia thaxteri]|uniref:Vesicle transport protein USE1 n=1 Tax=Coemansia thaxteri TaxID=2663907 RepID=A0A9W8EF84_9FUNG|nr:hypothetical protein H4R26_002853 [Coemansia thaxteri]KAJ2009158.1 hypothetical protein GGI04_000671 [Coemansia thaxteri]KAJ2472372.1 hypothetical protein GGI02_001624 [Coemansia sp. RSA 2322]
MEHIVADVGTPRNGGKQYTAYQERADRIKQQIQPWVEKKNALVAALGDEESVNVNEMGESSASENSFEDDSPSSSCEQTEEQPKPVAKRRSSLAAKREELLGELEGLRRRGAVPDSVEGVERLLRSQRATQEDLTSDLVKMASALKSNSLAFGELVEQDKAVIQETAELLDRNVAGVGRHGARLSKYRKRAWGTTGLTWLMVLVVVSVFFILVLFMRIAPKRF